MDVAQPSQTAGSGSPAGGASATPTLEQLQAELTAVRADKESLTKSVQGLSRKNQEYESRLKALDTPPSETGEEYLSRQQAEEVADGRIRAWQEAQDAQRQEAMRQQSAFDQERARWLNTAASQVPESLNRESPVFKKAMELFNDPGQGLSREGRPLYPNAEYVAFTQAKLMLAGQSAQQGEVRAGAAFASAGASSGAPAGNATGKLSSEEFLKLTPEQMAKYQEEQFLAKYNT
jgi:hypothetical protein